MSLTIEERQRVVAAARSYLGTPYHPYAFVKGHGVDCATFLICAFADAGLVPFFKPAPYPPDWFLHRDAERYLEELLRYADEFDADERAPQAADVIVYRFGRTYSHGMIVIDWPLCIHSYLNDGVVEVDPSSDWRFREKDGGARARKFYALRRG